MDAQSEKILAHIIRNTRIAALGTLRDEAPHITMIQFVTVQDFSTFYIFANRLDPHIMDLQKNKLMSLLIAETDDGRADPRTLARVSIRGSAEPMQNGEPGFTLIKKMYIERFPASEALFKNADFGLWRINPKGGRFIAGLEKAYNISLETLQKVSER
ncbi:MAG: pyridoxamine 5'-phosphate oxidase family protein [Chloroflexi bacterium]|nr:pyridoxamine 5'-phosphate oxidase family protein [Chloroflexota bacterium]